VLITNQHPIKRHSQRTFQQIRKPLSIPIQKVKAKQLKPLLFRICT